MQTVTHTPTHKQSYIHTVTRTHTQKHVHTHSRMHSLGKLVHTFSSTHANTFTHRHTSSGTHTYFYYNYDIILRIHTNIKIAWLNTFGHCGAVYNLAQACQ